MKIHVWGTDFRRSTPELRKFLYVAPEKRLEKVRGLLALGFQDLVYLSTCNRVEFYTTAPDYFTDTRGLWLRLLKSSGLTEDDYYRGYHLEGKSAVRHLMRVASSLESLVVGEPQILGQLKEAIQWTKENGLPLDSSLERSFQVAFETAKKVRTSTGLAEKSVSVATLGLSELQATEKENPLRRVIVVGRSPISRTVVQWLRKNRPQVPFIWVNRSLETLRAIPEAESATLMSLSEFLTEPPPFSHLLTATSSIEPVFGKDFFEKIDRDPKVVFDFAQPPDVDKDVMSSTRSFVKHVQLEGLKKQAKENSQARASSVSQAEELIDIALKEFCLEQKEAPLLRDFSAIEPRFLQELADAIEMIEKEFPPDLQPKLIKMAEKLVKRNLHCSREHLRLLLRNITSPDDHWKSQ